MSYNISQYAVVYNRRFIFCPSPEDLAYNWKYALEHNYAVQAFVLNEQLGCYERLSSSMVNTIISDF